MTGLQERLAYTFKNIGFLEEALTHRSFAHEQCPPIAHNERMELLGDSVLGLIVVDLLVRKFPQANEGELSKHRSWLVAEPTLAQIAETLELGLALRLGRGEANSGGTSKPRLLACALEAVVAAVFLDGGFEHAQIVVSRWFKDLLEMDRPHHLNQDFKTQLQEYIQNRFKTPPQYQLLAEHGPAHNRSFHVQVKVGDEVLGQGHGKSKKQAEQQAAQMALEKLAIPQAAQPTVEKLPPPDLDNLILNPLENPIASAGKSPEDSI